MALTSQVRPSFHSGRVRSSKTPFEKFSVVILRQGIMWGKGARLSVIQKVIQTPKPIEFTISIYIMKIG
jgi:hypothetical protein